MGARPRLFCSRLSWWRRPGWVAAAGPRTAAGPAEATPAEAAETGELPISAVAAAVVAAADTWGQQVETGAAAESGAPRGRAAPAGLAAPRGAAAVMVATERAGAAPAERAVTTPAEPAEAREPVDARRALSRRTRNAQTRTKGPAGTTLCLTCATAHRGPGSVPATSSQPRHSPHAAVVATRASAGVAAAPARAARVDSSAAACSRRERNLRSQTRDAHPSAAPGLASRERRSGKNSGTVDPATSNCRPNGHRQGGVAQLHFLELVAMAERVKRTGGPVRAHLYPRTTTT